MAEVYYHIPDEPGNKNTAFNNVTFSPPEPLSEANHGDTFQFNSGKTYQMKFPIMNVSSNMANVLFGKNSWGKNSWENAKPSKILSDLLEFKDILDSPKDAGFKPTEKSILRQTRKADLNKQKVAGMEFGLDGDLEDLVEVTVDKEAGTKTIKEVKTGITVTYPIEKQHSVKVKDVGWIEVTQEKLNELLSNTGDEIEDYKSSVKPEEVTDIKDANLVISLIHGKTDLHAPVLDLDFKHLYVDNELIITDPTVNVALIHEYLTDIELISTPYEEGVIPLDFPHHYVPSSTPGHGHLYVDVEMTNEDFWDFLQFMSDTNFIEAGYCAASKARGYSALRLPWIKKEA